MTVLYLEVDENFINNKDVYAKQAIDDFKDGYGAGTCNVDANAFWSSGPMQKLEGWKRFVINIDDGIIINEL
jgi:hypothetical protein